MVYRLAEESDIDKICKLIMASICSMEERGIFQWDDIYPAREDFQADIQKQQLYIGVLDDDIAVVYTVNEECNVEAIRLDVFSENPFALSLYRNAGYEEVGFADWRKGRFFLMEKLL